MTNTGTGETWSWVAHTMDESVIYVGKKRVELTVDPRIKEVMATYLGKPNEQELLEEYVEHLGKYFVKAQIEAAQQNLDRSFAQARLDALRTLTETAKSITGDEKKDE